MTIRARELLLHPIALAALVVLVANDHWLKAAHPSWLTGKLSDAAGLAVFPLLLLIAVDRWASRAWRTVAGTIAVTALGFALIKAWPPATELYRVLLGLLQWPLRAILALAGGGAVGPPVRVEAVTDPGDLIVLPFTALAAVVAWRGGYLDAGAGQRPWGTPRILATTGNDASVLAVRAGRPERLRRRACGAGGDVG